MVRRLALSKEMVTDPETTFVYLSELLSSREKFFNSLVSILNENRIPHGPLLNTKDIWAVDYMPIQKGANTFIQFKYEPDYLQYKEFISSQTNTTSVCKAINLSAIESQVRLDGGNVMKGKDWVILTDKIFKENPTIAKNKLIEEIENLLEVRVITIPQEPGDFTGHADGMVRYYDEETILVNDYKQNDKIEFQKRLSKTLKNQGLRTIPIPYNPYNNTDYDIADGLYINYLQMNNFILMPIFHMDEDEAAYRQFEELFSEQTVATIDSREISRDGGVLNCITWNIKK